jgi:hypothetical protein
MTRNANTVIARMDMIFQGANLSMMVQFFTVGAQLPPSARG